MSASHTLPSLLHGKQLDFISPPSEQFDADIVRLFSDEKAMEFLPAMSKKDIGGWTLADAAQRREGQAKSHAACGAWSCVMVRRDTGAFVGICGLRDIDWYNRAGELGIILHESQWGRGFGGEAHYEVLRQAFEALRLERVFLVTASNNLPMVSFCRNVLQACHEGTSRRRFARSYTDAAAGYDDTDTFSVLAHEWPALKARLEQKFNLL